MWQNGLQCDLDCKVRQDGLQSPAGIKIWNWVAKRDGTKPPVYIHVSLYSLLFQNEKMKKVFLIIGKILSEYITEDMIRDIFMIIFLTNVPLNFYNTLLIKTHPSWIHINTTFSCFWLSGELSFKKTFYRFIFHWSFC